jgi:hypothetical protein
VETPLARPRMFPRKHEDGQGTLGRGAAFEANPVCLTSWLTGLNWISLSCCLVSPRWCKRLLRSEVSELTEDGSHRPVGHDSVAEAAGCDGVLARC